MSGVKLCKNGWITSDNYNFIFTRLVAKTEKAYQADIKRAKKRNINISSIKKYVIKETFHGSMEDILETALDYLLRNSKMLQEEGKNKGRKPTNVKKIEDLKELCLKIKKDIVETFKDSLDNFNKQTLMLQQKNENLKKEIKKLKSKIETNESDE